MRVRFQIWHLAAASFINGLGWTSDNPTRCIMIGEVLGADRLGVRMSIDIGTNNFTRVVGPIVGGAMFASIGIFGVFVLLTALYVVALIAACSIQYRNKPVQDASSDGALTHLLEGFRSVRGNYTVRTVLLITVIFNLFGWPLFSMVPVIAQDTCGSARPRSASWSARKAPAPSSARPRSDFWRSRLATE
jgi:transmembrane secretion effector